MLGIEYYTKVLRKASVARLVRIYRLFTMYKSAGEPYENKTQLNCWERNLQAKTKVIFHYKLSLVRLIFGNGGSTREIASGQA